MWYCLTFLRSLASLTLCRDMAFPERFCCTAESRASFEDIFCSGGVFGGPRCGVSVRACVQGKKGEPATTRAEKKSGRKIEN